MDAPEQQPGRASAASAASAASTAISLDIKRSNDTRRYIDNVHAGFALKLLELRTLAQRLEPAQPFRPKKGTDMRPAPRPEDIRHALRRYDVALMRETGFAYNTQRAFFHRDPQRTGRLLFDGDVTLLGTLPDYDRLFRRSGGVPPFANSLRSRMARMEAMFALLERRQALTGGATGAPFALFIGDRTVPFDGSLGFFRRRAPLLPQHRYQRLCVLVWLKTLNNMAVVVAERAEGEDGAFFKLHILSPEPFHAMDKVSLAQDVIDYWTTYVIDMEGAHPSMFATPLPSQYELVGDDAWPMVLPEGGDAELVYRLGALLESPTLSDPASWSPYGSLSALLNAHPVPGGLSIMPTTPSAAGQQQQQYYLDDWAIVTLAARTYPYTMLAGAAASPAPAPRFTLEERDRFRGLFVAPPPAVAPIGAKKKKAGPQDIEIRRVDAAPAASVGAAVTNPQHVASWSAAEGARFVAIRRAQEATHNQEPLLALKGWAPPSDAYAYSRRWRERILGSQEMLHAIGGECLAFLYGPGARDAWARFEGPHSERDVPRLAWEDRLEEHAPKLGTPGYSALLKQQPAMRAPGSSAERDRLLAAERGDGPLWWLMAVAAGVSPPESINRQVELEFVMSGVLASLAKDGVLRISPRAEGGAFAAEMAARLERIKKGGAAIEDWLGQHPRSTRAIAGFALLAWEWGKASGLRAFLAWMDRLWGAEQPAHVTRAMAHHFPVFRELVGPPLRPSRPAHPPALHERALLRFVEQLYGYDEGGLEARFGAAADGGTSARVHKNIGGVEAEIGGAGPSPLSGGRQPAEVYLGWQRGDVKAIDVNAISLRYRMVMPLGSAGAGRPFPARRQSNRGGVDYIGQALAPMWDALMERGEIYTSAGEFLRPK